MARGLEHDDRDFDHREFEPEAQARMPLSQGRGGGASNSEQHAPPDFDRQELLERIDRSTSGSPTVEQFLERLEEQGIHPIPSIQSNGRWNGISYEFASIRVKGSDLGRAYTPIGLQRKKGVTYDPQRDDNRLRALVPQRVSTQPAVDPRLQRDRSNDRRLLNPNEQKTIWDVGCFRIVTTADLAREHYKGNHARLQQDLRHLSQLKLIERHDFPVNNRSRTLSVVTLTKAGKQILSSLDLNRSGSAQAIYSGAVKPREVTHDSAIYRMYLAEAERIKAEGGRVSRVVLDYELKKAAYTELAQNHDLPPLAQAEHQKEVAEENHLSVVEGRIAFPDLRIEYEMPDGESRHIDLELATRNYRAAHIQSKAGAGFKIYVDTNSGRLAAVLDDHNLIAELLRS